jgi:hypothetical protein
MSPVPDHGEENYKGSGRHRNRPVRTNIVPDGPVGQQAFAAIREAIRKEGMAALGRWCSRLHATVLNGLSEHPIPHVVSMRREDNNPATWFRNSQCIFCIVQHEIAWMEVAMPDEGKAAWDKAVECEAHAKATSDSKVQAMFRKLRDTWIRVGNEAQFSADVAANAKRLERNRKT